MVKITFHTFSIGDPADPEIYAAGPLCEFMETEKGQWIKQHCTDPLFTVRPDFNTFGQKVVVYGEVEDKSATEYFLKFENV